MGKAPDDRERHRERHRERGKRALPSRGRATSAPRPVTAYLRTCYGWAAHTQPLASCGAPLRSERAPLGAHGDRADATSSLSRVIHRAVRLPMADFSEAFPEARSATRSSFPHCNYWDSRLFFGLRRAWPLEREPGHWGAKPSEGRCFLNIHILN